MCMVFDLDCTVTNLLNELLACSQDSDIEGNCKYKKYLFKNRYRQINPKWFLSYNCMHITKYL